MTKDRRTALLDAAIEQIAAKGVRGMRVGEVARSAGVSPALIYHHFGDRATLLQSALIHIGERADEYTGSNGANARARLIAMLSDEFQDDADIRANSTAWGELRDTAIFNESLRPTIKDLTQRWIDDIAELINLGAQDGSIAPNLDGQDLGAQLTALAEGLSSRWLADMITTDQARQHLAAAVEALVRDMPGEGPRPKS